MEGFALRQVIDLGQCLGRREHQRLLGVKCEQACFGKRFIRNVLQRLTGLIRSVLTDFAVRHEYRELNFAAPVDPDLKQVWHYAFNAGCVKNANVPKMITEFSGKFFFEKLCALRLSAYGNRFH